MPVHSVEGHGTHGGGSTLTRGRFQSGDATPTREYLIPGVILNGVNTVGVNAHMMYEPFVVWPDALRIDLIGVDVTTAAAAGTLLRLGIYNASELWQPGTVALDAGTVAIDTTGTKTIAVDTTLQPGKYLSVQTADASSGMLRAFMGSQMLGTPIKSIGASPYLSQILGIGSGVAGGLPSPGTAWKQSDAATNTNGVMYTVFYRPYPT